MICFQSFLLDFSPPALQCPGFPSNPAANLLKSIQTDLQPNKGSLNSNQNPTEFIETYWTLIKIHPHSLKSNQHPSQVHWIPIKIHPKWGLQWGLQWVHPNSKKKSNPNVSIFLYNSFVQNAFLGRREPITTNIPKPHINFGGTDTHDNLGGGSAGKKHRTPSWSSLSSRNMIYNKLPAILCNNCRMQQSCTLFVLVQWLHDSSPALHFHAFFIKCSTPAAIWAHMYPHGPTLSSQHDPS